MLFESSQKDFKTLVAKSADLTNKPFQHSVINVKGEIDFYADELDITLNILCRDIDGRRVKVNDLEIELFRSNKDIVLVIAKLNFPDDPILWSGNKVLWMDGNTGQKCNPPNYSSLLENLANRIRSFIDDD